MAPPVPETRFAAARLRVLAAKRIRHGSVLLFALQLVHIFDHRIAVTLRRVLLKLLGERGICGLHVSHRPL
jgi:hypothetical protein